MRHLLTLLLPLFLAACPSPFDVVRNIDGRQVIHHVDYKDNPCGTRGWDAGCSKWIDGVQHVWTSGVAPRHVLVHEFGHDEMLHTAWEYDPLHKETCATVTRPGPGYPLGATICKNDQRERVFMMPKG